jgi:hypothetical protein
MLNKIMELDLDPIKVKLMHVESGEGWSLSKVNFVESEYRRFLELAKKFPDDDIACSKDVDTFWHYHILDTLKYAEDCQNIFGHFLHHFPYHGMRGEEDQKARAASAERMHALYAEVFGESCPSLTPLASQDNVDKKASGVAYSAAAKTSNVAYSAIAAKTSDVAYSAIAAKTSDVAYSAAAKTSDVAYSAAAKTSDVAYSAAAKTSDVAYSAAAKTSNVAYSAIAAKISDVAYRGIAAKTSDATYNSVSETRRLPQKMDLSRPSLKV